MKHNLLSYMSVVRQQLIQGEFLASHPDRKEGSELFCKAINFAASGWHDSVPRSCCRAGASCYCDRSVYRSAV